MLRRVDLVITDVNSLKNNLNLLIIWQVYDSIILKSEYYDLNLKIHYLEASTQSFWLLT
jgi:hypothetical protein